MKVLLYSEGMKYISKSGVGKAIDHQQKALGLNQIDYTTDKSTNDYSVVHINTVGPGSCLLAKKARRKGKKVIIHAHSTEEDFKDSFFFSNAVSPIFKRWLVYSYGLADEIITPTPYSKKIIESYDIDLPVHAVSNGIDLDTFMFNEEKRQAFRKKYNFSEEAKIILSVGLYIKRKGILDFFEVAKKLPEYDFVWCGYTSPNLLAKEIKELLKSPPSNVHLLGYVQDMDSAYSACDCFFMPTHEETEGIVLLEALAAKKPVVIRDIPVYDDWLTDKVNCYKGSSKDEFIGLIQGVITKTIPDLSVSGYNVVKERSLDKIGTQLAKIYENDYVREHKHHFNWLNLNHN